MSILSPVFQIEIRFTPILNFKDISHIIVSPFVPLATSLGLGSEGTKEERYNLDFENENYKLIVAWDRIVLKFEGDFSSLLNNNSIIEEPFLNMFNKIKQLEEFGKVNDVLIYTIMIKESDLSIEDINKNFIDKYFTLEAKNILTDSTDSALVFEKKIENEGNDFVHITAGPYKGLEDLKLRKSLPNFLNNDLFRSNGEMIELKIFKSVSKVNFSLIKDLISQTLKYNETLWKKD